MTLTWYGPDVLTVADELTEAYAEVFTAPPWEPRDFEETRAEFRERLETDVHRPGFRAVLALSEEGGLDGFATGWTTRAPFRADRAYGKVTRRLGAERVSELLVGCFEIDELGVRSRARGTGLGRRLLSALSSAAPGGRAWLMTWIGAPQALALYRRAGWREPEPLPGEETDMVVFVSPGPADEEASGSGTQASVP
ncbi:GNAT family N-acetyltransferase [Streptomyces sp. NRRL B-1140]|uniref:GNAT family N-acetyltransferase n=1 Tax=Streptomyces sp. NRRL B-1140 TaxID=1415549 RepID=UPI0006AD8E12|nr:GNAT family N-acetyltransferase [Streptomyces sp. NRRL B-1140]